MTTRKRGLNWMADFMVAGNRYRATFSTESEAKEWELLARADVRAGIARDIADVETAELHLMLADADPEDAKVNRELRNRIHVARMFLSWIGDAIEAGQQAHRQLQEMEGLARSQ